MSYRPLPLACYCGEIPDRILEVGFTSEQHMVVHFWCSSCSRVLFITRTLEECAAQCPTPDAGDNLFNYAREDAQFLQSIGISFEPQ
jgi:hypothetical protein